MRGVSELADLKIPLQQTERVRSYGDWTDRRTNIKRALPIYRSLRARMCHRVRSGSVYLDRFERSQGRAHFNLWCGQWGRIDAWGALFPVPPDGWPLCGTCEGRAVGAGYPGIAILQTRYDLIYSPREGRAPMPVATEAAG